MKPLFTLAALAALFGLPTLASNESAPGSAKTFVEFNIPTGNLLGTERPDQTAKKSTDLETRVAENAVTIFEDNVSNANYAARNLEGAVIERSNASNANFMGANLEGAQLIASNFTGAIFFGANLKGAVLRDSNFTNANFQGACLEGATFFASTFTGADLTDAVLTNSKNDYSNFSEANMATVDTLSSC